MFKAGKENTGNHHRKSRKELYCQWSGFQSDQPCPPDVKDPNIATLAANIKKL